MNVRIFFLTGLVFLFSLSGFSNEKPADPAHTTDTKFPSVVLPDATYTFEKIVDGQAVLHDFIVKNNGNATLEIRKVNPG